MRLPTNRIGRNRPDYARGATIYCKRDLVERARKYYVDEAVTEYLKFRLEIRARYKLPLGFGNIDMRRRFHLSPGPFVPFDENTIRGSLRRRAMEGRAFASLACSPRLFRVLMQRKKLASQKLIRMEVNLQKLGFHDGWKPLRDALQAAITRTVNELRRRRRKDGLGAEAYAIEKQAERRKAREARSGNPGSAGVEEDVGQRGRLVCCLHPNAPALQRGRPWAPRWWVTMLRSLYRSRADTERVERVLANDPEARLCVVYGIVMVVCVRKGEKPHFLVLEMERLADAGPMPGPGRGRHSGLRAPSGSQSRRSYMRKRLETELAKNERGFG